MQAARIYVLYQIDSIALCGFFFFNDTATTEIYTLSLHDALPISYHDRVREAVLARLDDGARRGLHRELARTRSEEHTAELQSRSDIVGRLLPEKYKGYCRALP